MWPQSRFHSDLIRLPGLSLCLLSTGGVSAHRSTSQHAGIWERALCRVGCLQRLQFPCFSSQLPWTADTQTRGDFPSLSPPGLSWIFKSLLLLLLVFLCLGIRGLQAERLWFRTWSLNASFSSIPPPPHFLPCWCHSAGLFNSSILLDLPPTVWPLSPIISPPSHWVWDGVDVISADDLIWTFLQPRSRAYRGGDQTMVCMCVWSRNNV